jgi:hypothetical protein
MHASTAVLFTAAALSALVLTGTPADAVEQCDKKRSVAVAYDSTKDHAKHHCVGKLINKE